MNHYKRGGERGKKEKKKKKKENYLYLKTRDISTKETGLVWKVIWNIKASFWLKSHAFHSSECYQLLKL